ncbi:MAG: glycosyltransferase [Chloroflexi bacterium]|nr:MAG: glycosyltransferase [Chloroflexota bacterium]
MNLTGEFKLSDRTKTDSPDVALFLPSLRGGGAERVMLRLAEGFAEYGLAVDLVLVQYIGEYTDQVPSVVRVVNLKSPRVMNSLPLLVKYLCQVRPRAMISAMSHVNIVAILALKMARVNTTLVVTEHNHLTTSIKHNIYQRARFIPSLMRILYPWAEHIVAISEEMKRDLQTIISTPIEVIYNPVITQDVFREARKVPTLSYFGGEGFPLILAAGRLTYQKDFETLIRSFSIVRRKFRARLVIIGEGDDRNKLESLVADLGLKNDVLLPGFIKNPYALMAKATAFVLSSRWEGLPTVLIEALALGTPIVSTDCPSGPREVLRNGDFGLLVPVGDPQAMATAILTVLDAPERYGMTPEREEWVMQNFALDQAVQKYLQVMGYDE